MNKADLIEKIALRADLSKAKASEALDAMLLEIVLAVKKGDDVRLTGFGTFSSVKHAERVYRTPLGEAVRPAGRHPKFKVGKIFKDAVK